MSTEIASSGEERLVDNTSDALEYPAAKFQIFELESNFFQNSWELHSGLVSQTHIYICKSIYISEKEQKKILSVTPVYRTSRALKNLISKYIKQMLVENRKDNIWDSEKVLKVAQDKVVLNLAPIIKLSLTMEEDKSHAPAE